MWTICLWILTRRNLEFDIFEFTADKGFFLNGEHYDIRRRMYIKIGGGMVRCRDAYGHCEGYRYGEGMLE